MSKHKLEIDNSQVPEGYKKTEVGVIPEEWKTMVFSEIASCRKERIDPRKSGTQEFCIELEHIESGTGRLLGNTQTGYQSSLKAVFQPGDVLFGKLRSYLRKYWLADREGVCSTEIWVLVANSSRALSEFLYQIVTTEQFIDIASIAYGTHMPRSDWNLVKNYNVAVPPVKEQCAIAQTLSNVDGLIAALDQAIAKKRNIKTATMQELLTGKKRLPGFGDEWHEVLLGELGVFSKVSGIKKDDVLDYGFACIRYGEIYTKHYDFIKDFYSFISEEIANNSQVIKSGDLLFAGSGETAEEIGKCVAFLKEKIAYAGGDIIIFSPKEQDSMFLGYLMNYESIVRQKARMGQGDAVVHIQAKNLAQLQFNLPSLEEQRAIASILSDMDAEIAALEKRRAKTKAMKQGMMQKLLTGKTRLIDPNNPCN